VVSETAGLTGDFACAGGAGTGLLFSGCRLGFSVVGLLFQRKGSCNCHWRVKGKLQLPLAS